MAGKKNFKNQTPIDNLAGVTPVEPITNEVPAVEVEKNDKYSVFTYFLTPDYDFKQDVLSFGDKVEVLEPKELREEMKEIVEKLNKIYR